MYCYHKLNLKYLTLYKGLLIISKVIALLTLPFITILVVTVKATILNHFGYKTSTNFLCDGYSTA